PLDARVPPPIRRKRRAGGTDREAHAGHDGMSLPQAPATFRGCPSKPCYKGCNIMKIRVFLTAALLAAFGWARVPAAPALMPLVGGVSYSIGSFPKQPIAGITPIGEMIEATADTGGRRTLAAQHRIELPITAEHLAAAVRAASARIGSFANRPADVQTFGLPAAEGSQLGALLRPIATPLVMSGMDAPTSDLVSSMFRESGFTPVMAGGA